MKILHYGLGLPPFRTGGLVVYYMDIIRQQKLSGHEVGLLYPGAFADLGPSCNVSISKPETKAFGFEVFEIQNALPVILTGTTDPSICMAEKPQNNFYEFFKEHAFDVVHIHTFMGMPFELVDVLGKLGIPWIYSVHDYYPICAKHTLMFEGRPCLPSDATQHCHSCNQGALSLKKVQLMQSRLYRCMKNWKVIKRLRKAYLARRSSSAGMQLSEATGDKKTYRAGGHDLSCAQNDTQFQCGYTELRKRYMNLLEQSKAVIYNSKLTASIFSQYYQGTNTCIMPIANQVISAGKARERSTFDHMIHFVYLGGMNEAKGPARLVAAAQKLWDEGQRNFVLDVFGMFEPVAPFISVHESFDHANLYEVLYQEDVMVVPSIWNETFGFVVAEALCSGMPVIASDTVGAQDLLEQGAYGWTFHGEDGLYACMKDILTHPKTIDEKSASICETFVPCDLAEHEKEMELLYKHLK